MPALLAIHRITGRTASLLTAGCSLAAAVSALEACDASGASSSCGLSLLQTGLRRLERGERGMSTKAFVVKASADTAEGGSESDAIQKIDGSDGDAKGEKDSDGVQSQWLRELLRERAAQASVMRSLEETVFSKVLGNNESATMAKGVNQLAKNVGDGGDDHVNEDVGSAAMTGGNCTVPSKHDSFDSYLGCLADRCEDGSAELSGGVGCSVIVSAGCGTDLHSLQDDVPAGLFVGRLCASSCGWCGDDPRAQAAKAAVEASSAADASALQASATDASAPHTVISMIDMNGGMVEQRREVDEAPSGGKPAPPLPPVAAAARPHDAPPQESLSALPPDALRKAQVQAASAANEPLVKTVARALAGPAQGMDKWVGTRPAATTGQEAESPRSQWSPSNHSVHDVVGSHGVLKIGLEKRKRWKKEEQDDGYQALAFQAAGISPTTFRATDAEKATKEELSKACPLESEPDTASFCHEHKKDGTGCKSRVEQAIADSHRRAMIEALQRTESDWTLIIEDDVVPVRPELFNAAFQEAWQKVPGQYKMVRLGWCTFEEDLGWIRKTSDADDGGEFHLYNWMSWRDVNGGDHYYSGGCTTAYMLHRDIIPEILGIFPCCCPLDCCLERGLFYKPTDTPDLYRGQQVVTNMDTNNTEAYAAHYTFFNQSGVFVQDNRQVQSSRPEFNKTT